MDGNERADKVEYILQNPVFNVPPNTPDNEKKTETLRKKFIDGVNKRSRRLAESTVLEFENAFQEPEEVVAPKLSKTNFFRCGSAKDEVEYSATNDRGRLPAKERKREVEVQLKSIHSHGRYIVFVGGAGSGKTTLLKSYGLLVLDHKIEFMEGVEIVHLINIKDWSRKDGKYTPFEILFSIFNVVADEDAEKCGFEWLKDTENQKKMLLLLDGLDTAPWELRDDIHHDMINYSDKALVPVIIYNILYGNLFPYCNILLTSREYAIKRFPEEIRPSATIALRGLSRASIVTLVKHYCKDLEKKILEDMSKNSHKVMPLCSIPLFLKFVLMVYQDDKKMPEYLSGLLLMILENFVRSRHQKSKEHVRKILNNLMKLSLDGIKKGLVVFTKSDFVNNSINVEDIRGLVISAPSLGENVFCDQNLMEEDYSFFFVHQTIQELLAACQLFFFTELKEYEKLIDNQIHTLKYGVVRQMLCGLMFNEKTPKIGFVKSLLEGNQDEIQQKKEHLLKSLSKKLNLGNINPMEMLNLLNSLCECGADKRIVQLAKTNIKKINLSGVPLTASDLHALGSVAYHCNRLSILALNNCQLNTYDLKVLSEELRDSGVEITVFDVCFNQGLVKNSLYYLHELYLKSQRLNHWQCGFREIDILEFDKKKSKENSEESELQDVTAQVLDEEQQIITMFRDQNILDLSHHNTKKYFQTLTVLINKANETGSFNVSLTEYETISDLKKLCELLNICQNIQEFKISECELTSNQLEKIMQAIPEQEITMVNVFLAPDIEPKGWNVIGEITKKFKASDLFVTSCSLTEDKLKELKRSLKGSIISRFDISRNDNMNKHCLKQVGEIIENCETGELIMEYCNLTSDHIQSLKGSLRSGNKAPKLGKIDISGNHSLCEDGFRTLGQITGMCKTEKLDVSECDPSPEEIESFSEALHSPQITTLNVSSNPDIGAGLYGVGKILEKCPLKTLLVRQCKLEHTTLGELARGMGNSKIQHLDLGLYFMKPKETTEDDINMLLNLLPNITRELTLNGWCFGDREEEYRERLQNKLNELPFEKPGIKIILNRVQTEEDRVQTEKDRRQTKKNLDIIHQKNE
uniref:uncharacterized protein LOC120344460 isoform X1 n=1 Tax=Styela clava TaxID=7725 RepID=UPI00193A1DDB|nr:uncharacterized protein LOC120344460 isoform X1 [Styela clava]